MSQKVGLDGFLGRWIFALVLVLGTYNPSGFSYATWVLDKETSFGPVVVIVGLLLLIGWIFCVKTTFDALGWRKTHQGATPQSTLMATTVLSKPVGISARPRLLE